MKDSKKELAMNAYKKGSNCAQAVISAYLEELDMDQKTASRLMEGFGGGFGGMQEVCGAFSGLTTVLGYLNSDGSIESKTKQDTYSKIRDAAERFKEANGSIICFDILNGERPKHLKCSDVICNAVQIIEDFRESDK